jgi:predicted amidohydrolase YtcJ
MKHPFPALAAPALLALLSACGPSKSPPEAAAPDLIIHGGPIYTGRPGPDRIGALAVKDGRVLSLGEPEDLLALAGPSTEIIDLAGAALYPGFTDSHAHLLGIGMRELTLNLEGVGSIEELVEIVAAEVAEAAPGETIYGRGWIETSWPEARFPSRTDLDPVSPDHPVILERADGHAVVANSAALAKAGVTAASADPFGGRIERGADGAPTGMLIDAASNLVLALVADPSEAQKEEAYEVGARVYAAAGWTGVHNMSVDADDVAIMERLAARGALPIRVYNALSPDGMDWLAEHAPQTDESGRIITRAVKNYADGALGSRGAALAAPYADQPDSAGLLLTDEAQMAQLLARARAEGVQVATHAIGDRANRLVLDWYAQALEGIEADPRWRIEHAQIIDPSDIARFAEQKVIASMQPSHAIGDLFFAPARLGPDRLDGAYAWRSLLDAGAIVAGGSDAPVERGDPRIEFYAATARRALDGFQGPDWRPAQAVSREEALAMFTAAPAFASFQDNELGAIAPGMKADFTVFSKDLMTLPEAEIMSAAPAMTIVEGAVIWRAE